MTAKRVLIEDRLGRNLSEWVSELRDDGASWGFVAAHIERKTGVTVTDQTVRNWFGHLECERIEGGDWPKMDLASKVRAMPPIKAGNA